MMRRVILVYTEYIYIYKYRVMSFSGFSPGAPVVLDNVSLLIPALLHTLLTILTEANERHHFTVPILNLSLGGPGTDTTI